MATTIQTFFGRASIKQFSRDFLFRVKQINIEGVSLVGNEDLVYARSAQLPGRAVYPGSEGYSIEFYHEEELELRSKFEKASRAVWSGMTEDGSFPDSKGEFGMPGGGSVINLEVIDKELKPVKSIKLIGASIRDIAPTDYAIADGTGEILKFAVTFAYHFYEGL